MSYTSTEMFAQQTCDPIFRTTCVIAPVSRPNPVSEPPQRHALPVKPTMKTVANRSEVPRHFMDPEAMNDDDPTEKPRKKKVYKPGERLLKRLYKEHLAEMSKAVPHGGMSKAVTVTDNVEDDLLDL